MRPRFSIIIPTYHRNNLLALCLGRLAPGAQTIAAEHYEVIVTDDGLQTTAEQMIIERYGWAKWVPGPGKGPAANRNNGAKAARGDWLAFLDDDCLPDPQWLKSYADAIVAQTDCLVFEGRVYANRPRRSLAETAPIFETGGYLPSGNFVCRKDVFESLGGFDERFPYAAMEDVEFRLRLTKAGYSFTFVKEAAVCHPWRPRGGWRKLKQHQASTWMYLSIHPEERRKINSVYYLQMVSRGFIKTTIPSIVKFRGEGLGEELLQHLSFLQMAFYLLRSKQAGPFTTSQEPSA